MSENIEINYKNQLENLCQAYVDAQTSLDEKASILHTLILLIEHCKLPALLSEPFIKIPLLNGHFTTSSVVALILDNTHLTLEEKNHLFPLQKKILSCMFELDLASNTDNSLMLTELKRFVKKNVSTLQNEDFHTNEFDTLIKCFRREKKQRLINTYPSDTQKIASRKAVDILMQVCYLEEENRYDELRNYLNELYAHPLFQVMIDFLAVSALGKFNDHQEGLLNVLSFNQTTKPDFKIIAFRDSISTLFKSGIRSNNLLLGNYTHNKSIYLTTKNRSIHDIVKTIMHEATHYICLKLFNNVNPFEASDIESKNKLSTIFQYEVSKEPYLRQYTDEDYVALQRFDAITARYQPDDYLSEFIVRVPEIMVLLGPQRGYQWLEQNRHGLLQFFEQHVVSKMKELLQQRQANQYLNSPINYSSSSPSSSLQLQKHTFFSKLVNIKKTSSIQDWAASLPDDANHQHAIRKSVSNLV